MAVISETATNVAEKAVSSRKLKIKILAKKPVINSCEISQQVCKMNAMEKPTSAAQKNTAVSCGRNLNLISPGSKRMLEGAVEFQEHKRLKMDRCAALNCRVILGELMKHKYGNIFNRPVDPVALHIPDYFDLVKNPMDLGTIKQRLDRNFYSDVESFESDVRLTFTNAMLYNPPFNAVHKYAKELKTMFDNHWKPVKSKLVRQRSTATKQISDMSNESMDDTERKCGKTLSAHVVKLPRPTILPSKKVPADILEVSGEKKMQCKRDQAVKVEKAKGSKSSKTCGSESDSGFISRAREENACSVSARTEIVCARPVQSAAKVVCGNAEAAPPQKRIPHNEVVNTPTVEMSRCNQNSNGTVSCSDDGKSSTSPLATNGTGGAASDGLEAMSDIQLSPSKALRAAMLKSRFAETILKAQQHEAQKHGTLSQPSDRASSVELQREKERLKRIQREEKARLEAEFKAAESAARLKAGSELKKRREQERENARIALEKMERSVDLDDNFHVLRELESLLGSPLLVLRKCRDGRSLAVWDQLGSGKLASPLEQLGLFMKAEYMVGDDDDDLTPQAEDWEEGEVIF